MKKNHVLKPHSIRWQRNQRRARSVLQGIVVDGGYPLAERKTGMDRGYLHAVVHGKKPASPNLLEALGIGKSHPRTSLNLRVDIVTATDLSNLIHRAMLDESLPTLARFVERVDKLVTKRMKSQTLLS